MKYQDLLMMIEQGPAHRYALILSRLRRLGFSFPEAHRLARGDE